MNNVDLTTVYGVFAALLIASGILLYVGTIGLKGDKKDDDLYKEDKEIQKWELSYYILPVNI